MLAERGTLRASLVLSSAVLALGGVATLGVALVAGPRWAALPGLLLLAAAGGCLLLLRRLVRPLGAIVREAGALAEGRYGTRLPVPSERLLATLARRVNHLAAAIEEDLAAARAEGEHLRVLLESLPNGVLVVARSGRALSANRIFRELFEVPEPVAGRLPLEVTRRREVKRLIEATLERRELCQVELSMPGPERRTLVLSGTPLEAPSGERPEAAPGGGAVIVVSDTTQFTRLAEMRRDFVANVSHELKTPLAAIRGYAETLADGALEDPALGERFLGRILEQCRRLEALLKDLLTLSRLESVELERRVVDLGRVVRRAVETVAGAARAKGVSLEVDEESFARAAGRLLGDPEALERLAGNLLANAVKYNVEEGRVLVRLLDDLEPAPAPGGSGLPVAGGGAAGWLTLEVADTGIGIAAEALPRIFERFYRVDRGRSREEGGTGLGLAIVKHVAQAHGGCVEVASEPGRGTIFRVFLPVGQGQGRE